MRYFDYLSIEKRKQLFYLSPQEINYLDKNILSFALGATLYTPATRESLVNDILQNKLLSLISLVLCLEDAIFDAEIEQAEKNVINTLQALWQEVQLGKLTKEQVPFIFVRIRDFKQMHKLVIALGESRELLTGFVLPKFSIANGAVFLKELQFINAEYNKMFYAMPILESKDLIYAEKRIENLMKIAEMLKLYSSLILNVRIGATDLSGLFGLRRSVEMSIYDLAVVNACIADIINVLGRKENNYVLSGPVWEFFHSERLLKPQLRQSVFVDHLGEKGEKLRRKMIKDSFDGLIREVILDKANGLIGKTVIHPSHLIPVQALYVVTHEEYIDAISILGGESGGVVGSEYQNKMNERRPHAWWAEKIIRRSKIYGVFRKEYNFTNLL